MKKSLKPLHAPPPKLSSPMKTAMRAASHALALGTLLVGGAVWTISQQHPLYAKTVQDFETARRVVDARTDRRTIPYRSGPDAVHPRPRSGVPYCRRDLDQARKENSIRRFSSACSSRRRHTGSARAQPVGARGLMQVMPLHSGSGWGCGSKDLSTCEENIGHGVQILKQAIADAPDMRRALLGTMAACAVAIRLTATPTTTRSWTRGPDRREDAAGENPEERVRLSGKKSRCQAHRLFFFVMSSKPYWVLASSLLGIALAGRSFGSLSLTQ